MRSPLTSMLAEPRLERMLSFNKEREGLVAETVRRVVEERLARARDQRGLELALNDVCFHEDRRFRASGRLSDEDKELKARFRRLGKGLRRMSESELREALAELARWYALDVVGNFSPTVFALATRAVPVGLSLLFAPWHLDRSLAGLRTAQAQLRERILIEGQSADIARLARRATLVVTPTHLSNLDSVVVGFALDRAQLPPCTYGAGKNLFDNPLLAFFMRNLGAYRVDRRIKHDLYKDVLKAYSTVLLERGYHSLFFPGGTRSRSGALEQKLKLGLAGTALQATVNMMKSGTGRPIYFVPATLNYHLVLEAATLIEDYLKESGKSRYIIDDDESTRFGRVARYLSDTLRAEASMIIRFGEPMDVLGHRVSPDGVAHDERGRAVELRPFLTVGGEVKHDATRDAEYTRELGERIASAYQSDNYVLSTHLVAWVLFRRLLERTPGRDLFLALRGAEIGEPLPREEVLAAIDRTVQALRALETARKVRLGAQVQHGSAEALLDEALGFFALFHARPVARREGAGVVVEDRSLCFYYHNRLTSYGLEACA
jgi:glycerol-3-phosphate O-acyltransferase